MTDARDLINNEVVELSKSNNAILLNHITGTGKTVSALKIAQTCNNPLTLIVHYETTHKENIMKDIVQFGFNPENYIFTTYKSIHKHIEKSYGAVIADEVHHITDISQKSFRKLVCEKFVALSAEVPKPKLKLIYALCPKIFVHKVDLPKAIELGILPVPKIKLHWLELDDTIVKERLLINIAKTETHTKWVKSYEEFEIAMNTPFKWIYQFKAKLTDKQYYEFIDKIYNSYTTQIEAVEAEILKKNQEIIKNPSLRFVYDFNVLYKQIYDLRNYRKYKGNDRKTFVAETKSEYVKTLFNSLKGRKLAFTNSIHTANTVSKHHIHSKVKKEIVKQRIEAFKQDQIQELSCVNMMKESHNIPNLKHVIYQQMIISSITEFIQVRGRALRSDKTVLHLILMANTIDSNIIDILIENKLLTKEQKHE